MTVYLAVSLAAALWFAFAGVNRFDAKARGTGLGFRLLLIPGAMVFWPWLVWRATR